MPADDDDLVGPGGTAQLADHVCGLRVGQCFGFHLQTYANLRSEPSQPGDGVGVFGRDRSRGDLDLGVAVSHGPRVRGLKAVGGCRSDQARDRALGRCQPRTMRAILDGNAVTRTAPRVVPGHHLVEQDNPSTSAFAESVECSLILDDYDLSEDACFRGTDRSAQAKDVQGVGPRRDHPGRFMTAYPVRHHDLLPVYVLGTVLLQRLSRPVDRLLHSR